LSGLFSSIHYCPNVDLAFKRVSYIMKDVKSGWLIRLIHINDRSSLNSAKFNYISINSYCILRICSSLRSDIILRSNSLITNLLSAVPSQCRNVT
ncbi:unnamed protein product, partial [Heterotrigona itama]